MVFSERFCILPGVSASHVEQVMRKTADAVTQCKFESTDPASDDTVLYKILQVVSSLQRARPIQHKRNVLKQKAKRG